MWTKKNLETLAREKLSDYKFILVSNRQPVTHSYRKGEIITKRGMGGVITALEPVVKSCGGTWVVLSDGDADREASDEHGRCLIQDGEDSYTLRRLWLSREEIEGYYFGYANGALWPLCHMVYKRPKFRAEDWEHYVNVNRKFAEAVLEEANGEQAFIWIQDYHLALLAQMLKEKSPKQFITAHFWHIPWPAYEMFRICPQKHEILNGLLANDLIGFHIRYQCQNFLDVVDRELFTKIDRERDAVVTEESETLVMDYPISIDYASMEEKSRSPAVAEAETNLLEEFDLKDKKVIIGLDRIDYTKGIPERLLAMDELLKNRPELKGKVVMIQVGALSRVHIDLYKDLNEEINTIVEDVNWRHGTDRWQPIIFMRRQMPREELLALYRLSDVCVVSSLHDGMNLVAKEFVAACRPEKGMVVLSHFTGAARELTDAVMMNPYDRPGFADALAEALDMKMSEKKRRNKRMRQIVSENNIFRWAGKTISDLLKFDFMG